MFDLSILLIRGVAPDPIAIRASPVLRSGEENASSSIVASEEKARVNDER